MSGDVHLESLLAAGYAILLVAITAVLEWLGRHTQQRSYRYHTAGFRFHRERDVWECPAGARLERSEIDNELHVIRYRAPAHTCNACIIKPNCTHSDRGREISVHIDPWISSATHRFHQGISLALLALGDFLIAIELLRHPHGVERWMLSGLMAAITALLLSRAGKLRDHAALLHRVPPGNADGAIHFGGAERL